MIQTQKEHVFEENLNKKHTLYSTLIPKQTIAKQALMDM